MSTFNQSLGDDLRAKSSINKLLQIEKRVHDKLINMTTSQDLILEIYRELTKELEHIFDDLYRVDNENKIIPIKRIYANPERAVAKQVQEDNIVLPVISIEQDISDIDAVRSRYSPVLVHDVEWSDKDQRARRILSLSPTPLNTTFKINIWAKYGEDLDQILEQISFMFNPSLNIPNKFSSETQAFLVEEVDQTNTTYRDGEDRIIRRVVEIRIESYIPSPKFLLTSTGEIEYTPHIELDITTL
jgi:hypothetical protein